MAAEYPYIDITNTPEIRKAAEDVRKTRRPRLLRVDGEDVAAIVPAARLSKKPSKRTKTAADIAAFEASFGTWSDFDADTFLRNNAESRRLSTRERPDL